MDNARNIALLHRIREGDRTAEEELVRENAGLVRSVARRFEGRGQEPDDLFQIGALGLLKAVKNFDESVGCAFSTYAVHSIAGELKRFLRDDGPIKISREIKRRGYVLSRTASDFQKEHGREPRLSELCALCGMNAEEIAEAMSAQSPLLSLERTDEDDSPPLEALIGEDPSEKMTESIALHEALRTLPSDERALVFLRYFRCMTQSESARVLGLTQVTVSRREKKIMEKLRAALAE